jgi:hypothetical protein
VLFLGLWHSDYNTILTICEWRKCKSNKTIAGSLRCDANAAKPSPREEEVPEKRFFDGSHLALWLLSVNVLY